VCHIGTREEEKKKKWNDEGWLREKTLTTTHKEKEGMELSKEGGCTLMSKTREQIITHDELYYIDVAK
jgi:hypothetical protein